MVKSVWLSLLLSAFLISANALHVIRTRKIVRNTACRLTTIRHLAEDDDNSEALTALQSNQASIEPVSTPNTKATWVDPTAEADIGLQLSWWAYLLIAYPAVLFANDAFHFLPSVSPIPELLRKLTNQE